MPRWCTNMLRLGLPPSPGDGACHARLWGDGSHSGSLCSGVQRDNQRADHRSSCHRKPRSTMTRQRLADSFKHKVRVCFSHTFRWFGTLILDKGTQRREAFRGRRTFEGKRVLCLRESRGTSSATDGTALHVREGYGIQLTAAPMTMPARETTRVRPARSGERRGPTTGRAWS